MFAQEGAAHQALLGCDLPALGSALACLIQCAPTAQITSGGRTHPSSNRLDSVADERLGRVTGRIEAS